MRPEIQYGGLETGSRYNIALERASDEIPKPIPTLSTSPGSAARRPTTATDDRHGIFQNGGLEPGSSNNFALERASDEIPKPIPTLSTSPDSAARRPTTAADGRHEIFQNGGLEFCRYLVPIQTYNYFRFRGRHFGKPDVGHLVSAVGCRCRSTCR